MKISAYKKLPREKLIELVAELLAQISDLESASVDQQQIITALEFEISGSDC